MKETIWSKLRELWAIRRRCKQIKLQQRENRLLRSNESHGRTRRLTKIIVRSTDTIPPAAARLDEKAII
jgi:hypothetical protein